MRREPTTEYDLIQQNFAREAELYYEALEDGLVNQQTFVQHQVANRDFREDLEPWSPVSSQRGQQEGVAGILQE